MRFDSPIQSNLHLTTCFPFAQQQPHHMVTLLDGDESSTVRQTTNQLVMNPLCTYNPLSGSLLSEHSSPSLRRSNHVHTNLGGDVQHFGILSTTRRPHCIERLALHHAGSPHVVASLPCRPTCSNISRLPTMYNADSGFPQRHNFWCFHLLERNEHSTLLIGHIQGISLPCNHFQETHFV